ncbi:MAG: hypothetical protein KDH96_03730 [Candidatus Riesia sp.]|nr:hypothetical protein [Candidatus Riesia sp.]
MFKLLLILFGAMVSGVYTIIAIQNGIGLFGIVIGIVIITTIINTINYRQ